MGVGADGGGGVGVGVGMEDDEGRRKLGNWESRVAEFKGKRKASHKGVKKGAVGITTTTRIAE